MLFKCVLSHLHNHFLIDWLHKEKRVGKLQSFTNAFNIFIFHFISSPLFLQDPLPPLTWGKIHCLEILGIPDVSLYGWSAEEVCASVRLRSEQYELFHWSTVNSYQSWAPSGWLSVTSWLIQITDPQISNSSKSYSLSVTHTDNSNLWQKFVEKF